MSNSPNTFTGDDSTVRSVDESAPGLKPKNSDALDRKSFPQSSCYRENILASSDQSTSSVVVQNLNSASSKPVFRSCESPSLTVRRRAKSVPTIVEQQVALFLRTISDDINSSYGNSSRNATNRNRRASYPGNPLLHALPLGIPSPTNFQRGSTSESQEGTVIRHRRTGIGTYPSRSSMGSVPEEESDSGHEV